jgi:phage tail-like protein
MPFGSARTFHKKFKFVIEIDDVAYAGFQKCSALEAEIAKIEQWEGGTVIPNKSPGRVTVSDITLERGASSDQDMFVWFSQVVDLTADAGGGAGGIGAGLKEPLFKRSFDIVQLDRDGEELRRWSITGAWPCKFSGGEWDNNADENVIESVTLCIDTFTPTFNAP